MDIHNNAANTGGKKVALIRYTNFRCRLWVIVVSMGMEALSRLFGYGRWVLLKA